MHQQGAVQEPKTSRAQIKETLAKMQKILFFRKQFFCVYEGILVYAGDPHSPTSAPTELSDNSSVAMCYFTMARHYPKNSDEHYLLPINTINRG